MAQRRYHYIHRLYTPNTPIRTLTLHKQAPKPVHGERTVYIRIALTPDAAVRSRAQNFIKDGTRAALLVVEDDRQLGDFLYDVYITGDRTDIRNDLKMMTHTEVESLYATHGVPSLAALPRSTRERLVHRMHDQLDDGPWLERLDHLTSQELTTHAMHLLRRYEDRYPGIRRR